MVVPRRCLERACPDSVHTISLRDDRLLAKQAASERATHSAVASERLAGPGEARYPIYGSPISLRCEPHVSLCTRRRASRERASGNKQRAPGSTRPKPFLGFSHEENDHVVQDH